MKKRFLAMLLVVCMVLSITPTSTFAEISPQVGEGNVCTHHIHDEKCGYTQALAQVDCDKNCTDTDGDGVIDHTADCAYSPAVAANKCNFDVASCEICHPKNGETADAGTALPSETPVLAKTDAPTTAMATVAKETAIQPSVSFVLDNETAYADTATWAVYDSETATTAREDIVASCNANTLTLAHKTDLPVAVYYVAVTESGKAESARLALTVEGNVMPVAMLGAAANSGEIALDPSVQTLVSGTTYTVANADELTKLATLVNDNVPDGTGYTVKMLKDINLTGISWTPIGKYVDGTKDKLFVGTFDGCGFEVQNLTINNTSADNQGLFGYVDYKGIVRNVGVTGNVSGSMYVGGIVGWNNGGTIQNCYSAVTVSGLSFVGGITGKSNGIVEKCYNAGTINSVNNTSGGVVGWNNGGTVQNCYNTGKINSTDTSGGVVGWNDDGTLQNCYSTGNVTGETSVGGIIGHQVGFDSKVENCVSLGSKILRTNGSTAPDFGRVVGLKESGTLANNKARSDMLVNNAIVTVGLANNINGADVIVDTATQASIFGGWNSTIWAIPANNLIVGKALPTLNGFSPNKQNPTLPAVVKEEPKPLDDSITTLENGKFYTVETKEQLVRLATLVNDETADDIGYMVKMLKDIDLTANKNWTPIGTDINDFKGTFDGGGFEVQNLTINNTFDNNQGLFGCVSGTVKNVGVTGNINGSDYIGSVVAWNNSGTVENCYSAVTITGGMSVGGVVGGNVNSGIVQNCYSTKNVSGISEIGGVVGYSSNGRIQNCYNTGTVSGDMSVGGVVGSNTGIVQNCVSLGASVLRNNGITRIVGRVIGLNENGTLKNNKARSDMLVNNATVSGGLVDNTNGADVVVGTASQTEVFASAIAWNETVWTIPTVALVAGEILPTLKGFTSTQNPKLPAAAGTEIPLEDKVSSLEKDKTYTVANATQLAKLASLVNDATADGTNYIVRLTANINLNGNTNWTPIGKYVDGINDKLFVGTFDGCGFEVQNLTIADGGNYQGLFSIVGTGGTVKNLGVTGNVNGYMYVGGVVGSNNGGTIQNCHSTVTVSGSGYAAGIAGRNTGTVEKCYNAGAINGTFYNFGGVVGWNDGGTVQNCYNTGTINGTVRSGGVVGWNKGGTVQNCYNTGTVTGTDLVGGVIGYNSGGNAIATNCVSLGLAVLRTDGGTATTFGRVIGSRTNTNDNGNKARSDLYVIDGTVTGGALDDINGEAFDVGDGTTQASVFTAAMGFTTANGWNEISGNLGTADTLPTLAGFVSMQKPTVPQKANISDSITFANGTAVYDGNVKTLENATTTATGGKFTYTYAAEPGSSLDNNMPKSAGTYTVTASYTSPTETGSKTATFTITAKELTTATATVTLDNDHFIYDGKAKRPTVTVKDGDTTLTANTDYTVRYGNNRNAGTATVTVGFDGNYSGTATANFTIGKSPIAVSSGTVTAKTYDGEKTAEVTALDFHVLASGDRFTTTDYTIGAANFSDADVGTGKTVKGIATLVANGKTDNYTLTNGGAYTLKNGVITKGTYIAPPTKTISIKNGAERTGTITLADIFGANIPTDGAFGTVTAPTPVNIMTTVVKNGNNLTYTSQNNAANTTTTDIYTVKVTSKNYDDFDVTITFQAIDKTAVAISGLTAETNLVYNGKQQKGFTGTATVEGNSVPVAELVYTYTGTNGTIYNSTTAPTNAGSYKLVVAVNPTNADYTGKHTDINFTIGKAPLAIKADDKNILIGEAKPTYTATATGLVKGESLSGVTFSDNVTDTSKKASFTITPTGGTVSGGGIVNYETSYSTGTLFVNVDTSPIDTALANANTAKAGVITSEGNADTVENGTKFVTAAEMKAIEDAIATATSAKVTVANITDAKAAAATLDSAVATFTKAIKIGTKKVVTPPSPPTTAPTATPTPAPTTAPTATPTPAPTTAPTATPTPKATVDGNETQKPKPTTQKPTIGKATATAEVDADGKATVTVPEKSITDAITKAQQTAKKNGTEQNGISVEVEISGENINSVSTTLSEKSIKELVDAGVKEVTFKSEMGDITLDLETLEQIQKEQGDITISVSKADVSTLDEKLKEEIGDRPVYELNLTKADGTRVTNFDGSITIAIPYTLQEGEDPANIAVVYINEKGEKEVMNGSGYDEKTQSVIFTTRHFSTFAIVLMPNEIDAPLTDIEQTEDTTTDLGNANETANTQGGISTGIMVTIVIAGILAIAIVAVGVVAIVKKRRE